MPETKAQDFDDDSEESSGEDQSHSSEPEPVRPAQTYAPVV